MSKKRRFGLGLIVGAIAGVVTGLLTAPKSGKETRADLQKKAQKARSDAEGKVADTKQKAEGVVGEVKEKVEELKERAGNAVKGAQKGFNKETASQKAATEKSAKK